MAEMRIALIAMDFRAPREPAVVDTLAHNIALHRGIERRPAGAGIKLGLLVKERRIAADAPIEPRILGKNIMGKGALRAMRTRNLEGLIAQLHPPFLFGLYNFDHGISLSIPCAQGAVQANLGRKRPRAKHGCKDLTHA